MNCLNSCLQLGDQLNHVGHTEFVHVESPSVLKDEIRSKVVVASVQGGSKELLFLLLNEEFKKLFNDFCVISFLSSFNGISVHFVLLGKINGLLEFTILSV